MAKAEVLFNIKTKTSEAKADMDGLNAKASQLGKVLGGLAISGAGFAILGSIAKEMINVGAAAESVFALTSTLMQGTEKEIQKVKTELTDLSASYGVTGQKAAEAAYQALSAGVEQTRVLEFMDSAFKTAASSGADLTGVVDVSTTVLNAYNLEGEETERVMNMLIETQNAGKTTVNELASSYGKVLPIAAAVGVTFEEVSAVTATMTAQGIGTAETITMQKALFNELSQSGSKVAKIIKNKTGKSFQELKAEGVPLADVLGIIKDEADRQGTSMNNLFGSVEATTAALALSGDNAESFQKNLDRLTDSTSETDGAFEKMSKTFDFQASVIKEKFNAALIKGYDILKAAFAPAIKLVADNMDTLAPIIIGVGVAIGLLLVGIGLYIAISAIAAMITMAMVAPFLIIIAVVAAVIAAFVLFGDKIKKVLQSAIEKVKELKDVFVQKFGEIKTAVAPIVEALKTFIVDNFKKLKDAIQPSLDLIKKTIQNVWKSVSKNIVPVVEKMMDDIKSAFEKVRPYIENFLEFIQPFIDKLIEAAATLVNTVIPAMVEFAQKIWEIIKPIAEFLLPILKVVGVILLVIVGIIIYFAITAITWILKFVQIMIDFMMPVWTAILAVIKWVVDLVIAILKWMANNWKIVLLVIVAIVFGWIAAVILFFIQFKDKIVALFTAMWNWIVAKFNQGKAIVLAVVGVLKQGAVNSFYAMRNGIVSVVDSIITKVNNFKNKIIGIKDTIVNAFKDMVSGIATGISTGVDTLIATVKNMVNTYMISPLNSAIGTINKIPGVSIGTIPSLAIGTNEVYSDGLAMIHKGESIVPADVAKGGYKNDSNDDNNDVNEINIEKVEVSGVEDIKELVDSIMEEVAKKLKGTPNYRKI